MTDKRMFLTGMEVYGIEPLIYGGIIIPRLRRRS
jgi:hypothetical protein